MVSSVIGWCCLPPPSTKHRVTQRAAESEKNQVASEHELFGPQPPCASKSTWKEGELYFILCNESKRKTILLTPPHVSRFGYFATVLLSWLKILPPFVQFECNLHLLRVAWEWCDRSRGSMYIGSSRSCNQLKNMHIYVPFP